MSPRTDFFSPYQSCHFFPYNLPVTTPSQATIFCSVSMPTRNFLTMSRFHVVFFSRSDRRGALALCPGNHARRRLVFTPIRRGSRPRVAGRPSLGAAARRTQPQAIATHGSHHRARESSWTGVRVTGRVPSSHTSMSTQHNVILLTFFFSRVRLRRPDLDGFKKKVAKERAEKLAAETGDNRSFLSKYVSFSVQICLSRGGGRGWFIEPDTLEGTWLSSLSFMINWYVERKNFCPLYRKINQSINQSWFLSLFSVMNKNWNKFVKQKQPQIHYIMYNT